MPGVFDGDYFSGVKITTVNVCTLFSIHYITHSVLGSPLVEVYK